MQSLYVVRSKRLFNGDLLNSSRWFNTEEMATTYIEWLKSKGHEVLSYSHYVNFSKETLDLIKRTSMIEDHDSNGPGSIFCPICGSSITMQWKNGRLLNSGLDIEHNEHCPVFLLNK